MKPTTEMQALINHQRSIFNGPIRIDHKEPEPPPTPKSKLRYSYGRFSDFTIWLTSCLYHPVDTMAGAILLPYKIWKFLLVMTGGFATRTEYESRMKKCRDCPSAVFVLDYHGRKEPCGVRFFCDICGCFKTPLSQNHIANRFEKRDCPLGKFGDFDPFIEWAENNGFEDKAQAMRESGSRALPVIKPPCSCHGSR